MSEGRPFSKYFLETTFFYVLCYSDHNTFFGIFQLNLLSGAAINFTTDTCSWGAEWCYLTGYHGRREKCSKDSDCHRVRNKNCAVDSLCTVGFGK